MGRIKHVELVENSNLCEPYHHSVYFTEFHAIAFNGRPIDVNCVAVKRNVQPLVLTVNYQNGISRLTF